jgi:hypothetical protein
LPFAFPEIRNSDDVTASWRSLTSFCEGGRVKRFVHGIVVFCMELEIDPTTKPRQGIVVRLTNPPSAAMACSRRLPIFAGPARPG